MVCATINRRILPPPSYCGLFLLSVSAIQQALKIIQNLLEVILAFLARFTVRQLLLMKCKDRVLTGRDDTHLDDGRPFGSRRMKAKTHM